MSHYYHWVIQEWFGLLRVGYMEYTLRYEAWVFEVSAIFIFFSIDLIFIVLGINQLIILSYLLLLSVIHDC